MKTKRLCPICNADEVQLLHSQKFELPVGHPLSNGYDIVVCDTCGFVFADTVVSQSDYDKFYAEHSKYEDVKTSTGGIENPFDWKRQQETAKQIADFLQNPRASILDVGCANGGMLKALKDIGYDVLCGIDPSPVCVENTRQLGIEAHQGSLFQPFEENKYDCVILSHTLEHVADLRGALEWIEERLKPNGIVYIETPDASRYTDFVYSPFQDFNTEHINHFSLTCLENLMYICGFLLANGGEKDLIAGTNMFYPAVFGFWKKTNTFTAAILKKDKTLRSKTEEYIIRSKQLMADIDSRINSLLEKNASIVVWGTGQLLMKLLYETQLARANILAFVDSNPINHGKILRNIPIISPDQLHEFDATILITTLLNHQAIAQQIKQMNLKNEIVFLQGD